MPVGFGLKMKTETLEELVTIKYKAFVGMSKFQAINEYFRLTRFMTLVRKMPTYGCSFFPACTELPPNGFFEYRTQDWHIGVGPNAIVVVDSNRAKLIHIFRWSEVYWKEVADKVTILVHRRQRDLEFHYVTPQAAVVNNLIKSFKYKWAKESGALPSPGSQEAKKLVAPSAEPPKQKPIFRFERLWLKVGKSQNSKYLSDLPAVDIQVDDAKKYLPDTELPENYATPLVGIIGNAKKKIRRTSKLFANLLMPSSADDNQIDTIKSGNVVPLAEKNEPTKLEALTNPTAIVTIDSIPLQTSYQSLAAKPASRQLQILNEVSSEHDDALIRRDLENWNIVENGTIKPFNATFNQSGQDPHRYQSHTRQERRRSRAISFDSSYNRPSVFPVHHFGGDLAPVSAENTAQSQPFNISEKTSSSQLQDKVMNQNWPSQTSSALKSARTQLLQDHGDLISGKISSSLSGVPSGNGSSNSDTFVKKYKHQRRESTVTMSGSLKNSLKSNSATLSDSEVVEIQPRIPKSRSHATQLMLLEEHPEVPSTASNDNLDEFQTTITIEESNLDCLLNVHPQISLPSRHQQPSEHSAVSHSNSVLEYESKEAITKKQYDFSSSLASVYQQKFQGRLRSGSSSSSQLMKQGFRVRSRSSSEQFRNLYVGISSESSSNNSSVYGGVKPLSAFVQRTNEPTIADYRVDNSKPLIPEKGDLAMFGELEYALSGEAPLSDSLSERRRQRRTSSGDTSISNLEPRDLSQNGDSSSKFNDFSSQNFTSRPIPLPDRHNYLKSRRGSNSSSNSGSRSASLFDQRPIEVSSNLQTKLAELSSSSDDLLMSTKVRESSSLVASDSKLATDYSSLDLVNSSGMHSITFKDANNSLLQSKLSLAPNPRIKEARLSNHKEFNPYKSEPGTVEIVDLRFKNKSKH